VKSFGEPECPGISVTDGDEAEIHRQKNFALRLPEAADEYSVTEIKYFVMP
jgi:hypothetical protein